MQAKFNDGSELFENQCVDFKRICDKCGSIFEEDQSICTNCQEPRIRCNNKAMKDEESCRVHSPDRILSIYNIVAAKVADTTLEELIEKGNLRDLTTEFALAKLAVAEIHAGGAHAADRLEAIASFFSIASTLQKIESGGLLNINWSDPLVIAVRNKFRNLIGVMVDLIDKYVPEEQVRKLMLQELKDSSKLIGNSVTIKPLEGNVDDVLKLKCPKTVVSSEVKDEQGRQ